MTTSTPKIMIPIMHKVMPNIIASNIVGVSPLTAPNTPIKYKIKIYYENCHHEASPHVYKHFLRLNNRKRRLKDDDFRRAGYYEVGFGRSRPLTWCQDKFGSYGFWFNPYSSTWWFVTEEDKTLFQMVWL